MWGREQVPHSLLLLYKVLFQILLSRNNVINDTKHVCKWQTSAKENVGKFTGTLYYKATILTVIMRKWVLKKNCYVFKSHELLILLSNQANMYNYKYLGNSKALKGTWSLIWQKWIKDWKMNLIVQTPILHLDRALLCCDIKCWSFLHSF